MTYKPAGGRLAGKRKMVKTKKIDATHLRKKGIKSIELFWDADIAVFFVEWRQNGETRKDFFLANPTDWHWMTQNGYDTDELKHDASQEVTDALAWAKDEWAQVRSAARLIGIDWLDNEYMEVATYEYTDVFVRQTNAPFLPTQHCGARIMPIGEFFCHMAAGGNKLYVTKDFQLAIDYENPQVVFVNIGNIENEIGLFLNDPEMFDGEASRRIIGCNGIQFTFDNGIKFVELDRYDFEIETSRDGYVIFPKHEPNFPYACLFKYKKDVSMKCG